MAVGLFILATVSVYFLALSFRWTPTRPGPSGRFIKFATFSQLATLLSTSFIEEEHEAWFFLGSTSLLIFAIWPRTSPVNTEPSSSSRLRYIIGSLFIRILRGWSHNGTCTSPNPVDLIQDFQINTTRVRVLITGQKSTPDRSMSHTLQSSPWAFSVFDLLGFACLLKWPEGGGRVTDMISSTAVTVGALLTLVPAEHPVWRLVPIASTPENQLNYFRAIYALLAISLGFGIIGSARSDLYTKLRLMSLVLLRSLTRRNNHVPLWLAFFIAEVFKPLPRQVAHPSAAHSPSYTQTHQSESDEDDLRQALASAWIELVFAKCTFFAFGGSNSLATSVIAPSLPLSHPLRQALIRLILYTRTGSISPIPTTG